jgi:hypothetical protein
MTRAGPEKRLMPGTTSGSLLRRPAWLSLVAALAKVVMKKRAWAPAAAAVTVSARARRH